MLADFSISFVDIKSSGYLKLTGASSSMSIPGTFLSWPISSLWLETCSGRGMILHAYACNDKAQVNVAFPSPVTTGNRLPPVT